MRALAVTNTGVEVIEAPDPEPADGGVVVEVRACGICGSDLHIAGSGRSIGSIIGHEFSGKILEIGDNVEGYRIGQPVAVNPLGSCGECEACLKGLPFLCKVYPNVGLSAQGAFAERIAVPARQLTVLDESIDLEIGSHAEPFAVGLGAIDLAEVEAGTNCLVLGVGTIGLFVIAGLRALGVGTIVAVGRSPGRREAASIYGADVVIDARTGDLFDQLSQLNLSFGAAFECTGAPEMINLVAPLMGIGGTIVEVALPSEPGPLDFRSLVSKGLRVVGSCAFKPSNYARAIQLLTSGEVDPEPIVSERVSLDEAPDAFERLRSPGNLVGILVEPGR
jgi:threonine dehydrogenase-like Zn-dependent dehydrogenase